MWRPDELCRQEADRKCPPSQLSPQWRQEAVRSGDGLEGAALSSAEAAPGRRSYSLAGGPPRQTPGALSPSAAQRSQPPALPFPPPVCPSPVNSPEKDRKTQGQGKWRGKQEKKVDKMNRGGRRGVQ